MSDDDLNAILAKRGVKGKRAKSTTALIVAIIFMLGMVVGVVLGRVSASTDNQQGPGMFQGPPPSGGAPSGSGPRN